MKLKKIWRDVFLPNQAPIQFQISVEMFNKKTSFRGAPFTTHFVMLKLLVAYAFCFFEHTSDDIATGKPRNRFSATIYYGLGPDSGPSSWAKRSMRVVLWDFKGGE
jgi:hypothetical protein